MTTNAFDYRAATWNEGNISGLQKRVGILLGLKDFRTRSLSGGFADAGLELVSEEVFKQNQDRSQGSHLDDDQDVRQRFQEVPLERPAGNGGAEDFASLFDEIAYLKNKIVSGSVLKNGIHLDRYRVESTDAGNAVQLVFRPTESEPWQLLASYTPEEKAVAGANRLRRFLIGLNVASEGFHVVEHLLLRPLAQETHQGITVPEDFYAFKLSVVFPAWTARFSDPAFRRIAQETVHQNCPAHVYPEFHWIELEKMKEFEKLYKAWLDDKSDKTKSQSANDSASKQLISFILEISTEAPPPSQVSREDFFRQDPEHPANPAAHE